MSKKKVIANEECYYGMVALVEKDYQKDWTSSEEGGIKQIEMISTSANRSERKNVVITLGEIASKSEKEILEFFKNLNPEHDLSMHIKKGNTWDNLFEEYNKKEGADFFEYHFVPNKKDHPSYIFSTYQGNYVVYQTKEGIECWSGDEHQEEEIKYKTTFQTIEVKKDTEFILGSAEKIQSKSYKPFKVKKGMYNVEIGYDEDDSAILFQLKLIK